MTGLTGIRAAIGAVVVPVIVLAAQGCCGAGKKSDLILCEGSLDRGGARYHAIGTNEDPAQARDSAVWGVCFNYCRSADPTVMAAHSAWRSANLQAPRRSVLDDIESDPTLEAKAEACREGCIADVGAARLEAQIDCHAPQGGVECTTVLEKGGKSWQASNSGDHSEYHSRRLACRRWCKEGDPSMGAAYDLWSASEKGKASGFSSRESAMEGDGILFDAVNACQESCMADLLAGTATAKTTCD